MTNFIKIDDYCAINANNIGKVAIKGIAVYITDLNNNILYCSEPIDNSDNLHTLFNNILNKIQRGN